MDSKLQLYSHKLSIDYIDMYFVVLEVHIIIGSVLDHVRIISIMCIV